MALQVHIAMALLRRSPDLESAGAGAQATRILPALRASLERGVPTAAGWLCLAQLSLKVDDAAGALAAAQRGLHYVSARAAANKEKFTQAGLALQLEAAEALRALGRYGEAKAAFGELTKHTSAGELTFPYVAGLMPLSVRQQAARGLAKVCNAFALPTCKYTWKAAVGVWPRKVCNAVVLSAGMCT